MESLTDMPAFYLAPLFLRDYQRHLKSIAAVFFFNNPIPVLPRDLISENVRYIFTFFSLLRDSWYRLILINPHRNLLLTEEAQAEEKYISYGQLNSFPLLD